MSMTADHRLNTVIEQISARDDATPPTDQAIAYAERLMGAFMTRNVTPAVVYHINDGPRRLMVAVHDSKGLVIDAECSCGAENVCPHLLVVLAKHDGRLDA